MKFGKFITLLLPAFLLASCGGGTASGDDFSGNDFGNDSENQTITNKNLKIMFHVDAKSAEGQAYKKRIDAFNTAYKDMHQGFGNL